jgi:hypothetical protein
MDREIDGEPERCSGRGKLALRVDEILEAGLAAGSVEGKVVRDVLLAGELLGELLDAVLAERPEECWR